MINYEQKYLKYKSKYLSLKGGENCLGYRNNLVSYNKIAQLKDDLTIILGAGNKDNSEDLRRFGKDYNVVVTNDPNLINFDRSDPPFGLFIDLNNSICLSGMIINFKKRNNKQASLIIFDHSVIKFIDGSISPLTDILKINGKLLIPQPFDIRAIANSQDIETNFIKQFSLFFPDTKNITGDKFISTGLAYADKKYQDEMDNYIIENNIKYFQKYNDKLKIEQIKGKYPLPLYIGEYEHYNKEFANIRYLIITKTA